MGPSATNPPVTCVPVFHVSWHRWLPVLPSGNVQGVLSVTNASAGPHVAACGPGSLGGGLPPSVEV